MSMHEAQTLPLTLGQQFAAARKRAGHDQTALGRILGCDRTTISRWERDQAEPPFTAVATLSTMSGWPLELFARAQTPTSPTPPDQGIAVRRCSVLPFQAARVAPRFAAVA
jgi:DNA-binding XRE family transcriptional regulator